MTKAGATALSAVPPFVETGAVMAEATKVPVRRGTDDEFCEDCGYQPQLKRSLGGFQIFAISFASMSVGIGIFSTYLGHLWLSKPDVLEQKSGEDLFDIDHEVTK